MNICSTEDKLDRPLVSIWCPTYNHVNYIRDALEGFLMQETSFPYEIVIHDDASNDGTVEILKEYEEKYPQKIKVIYQKENIYHKSNRKQIIDKIRREYLSGKYIAACEGDDYWIDKNKLEEQVQFMEENPEYVMSCHGAIWWDYNTDKKTVYRPYEGTRELTPHEIIVKEHGNISTASIVARRDVIIRDENYPKCCVGDIPTQFCAIYMGKVFYFDKAMSVYRFMRDGSWEKNMADKKARIVKHRIDMLKFYKEYNLYTHGIFSDALYEEMRRCFYRNVDALLELSSYEECENIRKEISNEDIVIESMYDLVAEYSKERELSSCLKEFIKEHKNIVLYGKGRFAHVLTHRMEMENIKITGYLVSDGKSVMSDDLSPVWNISNCLLDRKETGIIVAVHPQYTKEILKEIRNKFEADFVTPFFIDDKRLKTILLDD